MGADWWKPQKNRVSTTRYKLVTFRSGCVDFKTQNTVAAFVLKT